MMMSELTLSPNLKTRPQMLDSMVLSLKKLTRIGNHALDGRSRQCRRTRQIDTGFAAAHAADEVAVCGGERDFTIRHGSAIAGAGAAARIRNQRAAFDQRLQNTGL